jgi:integrase
MPSSPPDGPRGDGKPAAGNAGGDDHRSHGERASLKEPQPLIIGVRRSGSNLRVCTEAEIGDGWTPRELRTTFVSLLSHRGVSIEEIARLVGHASTRTTEIVYRRELRPVITTGAEIMDELFTGT